MTDIQATKDRILRVISAICIAGFDAGWRPSRRGFEVRERFFFDDSEQSGHDVYPLGIIRRNQIIFGIWGRSRCLWPGRG